MGKKNHTRLMTAMLVVSAVLGLAGAANADMIMFSSPYGPEPAAAPPHVVAMLPLFDPGLGTLTKVTWSLDSMATGGAIAWDNEAPIPSDVTLGIGAEVTASAMGLLTAITVPLQTGSAVGIAADEPGDGPGDFIGPDSFAVFGGFGVDSDMDMSMAPPVLAAFTGPGTFATVLFSAVETFLSTTGGYGPIDPHPGITTGMVKVTYEFIPIPEPASLALLAMGSLLLVRRRRKVAPELAV